MLLSAYGFALRDNIYNYARVSIEIERFVDD
jgi:hypothetical protein